MNKKQAKNLAKCITALKESPNPKTFDMSDFLHDPDMDFIYDIPEFCYYRNVSEYKTALNEYTEKVNNTNWCATPACVFGHFAFRSDLQKICKIKENSYTNSYKRSIIVNKNDEEMNIHSEEILNYFGITQQESELIFDGDGCANAKTPEQAIKFIKNFLKQKDYNWKDLI